MRRCLNRLHPRAQAPPGLQASAFEPDPEGGVMMKTIRASLLVSAALLFGIAGLSDLRVGGSNPSGRANTFA